LLGEGGVTCYRVIKCYFCTALGVCLPQKRDKITKCFIPYQMFVGKFNNWICLKSAFKGRCFQWDCASCVNSQYVMNRHRLQFAAGMFSEFSREKLKYADWWCRLAGEMGNVCRRWM
jgi:hypothetical protein